MKRFIALLLVATLFVLPLSIPASAAEVDMTVAKTASVQPRLNETITLSLGSAWTAVKNESNWFVANLTVTNTANSSQTVMIRIVSTSSGEVISGPVSIEPGSSAHFSRIPGGGYIIQGKSPDEDAHTYEIKMEDQF